MSDLIKREDAINSIYKLKETVIKHDVLSYRDGLSDALEIVQDLPSADRSQEWIPCSERLPEEDGYYLITLDFEWDREIEIGLWTNGEWFNDNRHVNIAWMPMIEPWKGADDD